MASLSTLFSAPHALHPLFILCTISISHSPSAATYDPRCLKQYTCSNCSPFNLAFLQPTFRYLKHLITLPLPTLTVKLSPYTYSTNLAHQFTQLLKPVSFFILNVIFFVFAPVPAHSQAPHHPYIHSTIMETSHNPHIHTCRDTRSTIYKKKIVHYFQQFSFNPMHS